MHGADLPSTASPVVSVVENPADGREPVAPSGEAGREADALAAVLRSFIHDAYLPAEPLDSLAVDLDLIESGILDSLGVVEVADFLEEQSGMPVGTHELTRSNIGTIAAMAAFVIRRRAAVGQ
jgi:acyl carrier protein